jgi:hypothetical protein
MRAVVRADPVAQMIRQQFLGGQVDDIGVVTVYAGRQDRPAR